MAITGKFTGSALNHLPASGAVVSPSFTSGPSFVDLLCDFVISRHHWLFKGPPKWYIMSNTCDEHANKPSDRHLFSAGYLPFQAKYLSRAMAANISIKFSVPRKLRSARCGQNGIGTTWSSLADVTASPADRNRARVTQTLGLSFDPSKRDRDCYLPYRPETVMEIFRGKLV
jgi:hypothetical protein